MLDQQITKEPGCVCKTQGIERWNDGHGKQEKRRGTRIPEDSPKRDKKVCERFSCFFLEVFVLVLKLPVSRSVFGQLMLFMYQHAGRFENQNLHASLVGSDELRKSDFPLESWKIAVMNRMNLKIKWNWIKKSVSLQINSYFQQISSEYWSHHVDRQLIMIWISPIFYCHLCQIDRRFPVGRQYVKSFSRSGYKSTTNGATKTTISRFADTQ